MRQEQTTKLRAFLLTSVRQGPAILVTHQVNITALTGVFPSSGEIIIFQAAKNGRGKILGASLPESQVPIGQRTQLKAGP